MQESNFFRLFFSFLFLLIFFPVFGGNIGTYDVVGLSNRSKLKAYKKPNIFSATIFSIPAAAQGIRTTWNTAQVKKEIWIEMEYEGERGWVKRKYLTNSSLKDLLAEPIAQEEIDQMLLRFAKGGQSGNFAYIDSLIYPLRGLFLYSKGIGKLIQVEKEELKKSWYYITDRRYTEGTSLNYFMEELKLFLESEFSIEKEPIVQKWQGENFDAIRNFHCVTIKGKNKQITVGLECWNKALYISYILIYS